MSEVLEVNQVENVNDEQTLAKRLTRAGVRLAGCVLAAGVVTAPSSIEYGVEHAQVQDYIGEFPTTFTYTGNATSRLKVAGVNAYLPASKYGIGIKADVEGFPPTQDISQFFNLKQGKALVSQYSNPEEALSGYESLLREDMINEAKNRWLRSIIILGGTTGIIAGAGALRANRSRQKELPTKYLVGGIAGALVVATAANSTMAHADFKDWGSEEYVPKTMYQIEQLQGTELEDLTVGSSIEKDIMENVGRGVQKYTARQEQINEEFLQTARNALELEIPKLVDPNSSEGTVLFYSDMHSNVVAVEFITHFVERYEQLLPNKLKAIVSGGDNVILGNAGESAAIKAQAKMGNGTPVYSGIGNHDSAVTTELMKDAGMHIFGDELIEQGGLRLYGTPDPVFTPLFKANVNRQNVEDTISRSEQRELQRSSGEEAHTFLEEQPVDVFVVHQKEAVAGFLGVENIDALMNGQLPQAESKNVPARIIAFGHEHDEQEPRILYNADGSWTLVLELGTAGGAIENPSYADFSFPTAPPKKLASFMMVTRNEETGLVSNYQRVTLYPNGQVRIANATPVGSTGPELTAAVGDRTLKQ